MNATIWDEEAMALLQSRVAALDEPMPKLDEQRPMSIQLSRKTGLLIVLSAPSGAGKSTISRALLDADSNLRYSISVTTRQPRGEEGNGQHYFFVGVPEFEEMISHGEFYEYARVHGNLYGTRKAWIEEQLAKRRDIVLDIDVQGGQKIKRQQPSALMIFILPPSFKVLEERLRHRGTNSDEDIRSRLDTARRELLYAGSYDYVVINDDLEETIETIQRIISVERIRSERLQIKLEGQEINL